MFSPGKTATEFSLTLFVVLLTCIAVLLAAAAFATGGVISAVWPDKVVCTSSVGPVNAQGEGSTIPETNCP